MKDIGQDQLLMLLLVMQTDFQDAQHSGKPRIVDLRQQALDRSVDMRAERADLAHCRAGSAGRAADARDADRPRRNRN